MNEFFNALKNKRVRKEYIKSVIVGLFTTVIDFLLTALIIYIAGHEHFPNFFSVFFNTAADGKAFYDAPLSVFMLATMVSFTLAIFLNYVLCVFFVFEYGNVGKNKKGFLKFTLFALIGLTLTTIGSLIGFALYSGNVWWIKITVSVLVFIFNFFMRKYFVFNIALIRDDENTINL